MKNINDLISEKIFQLTSKVISNEIKSFKINQVIIDNIKPIGNNFTCEVRFDVSFIPIEPPKEIKTDTISL